MITNDMSDDQLAGYIAYRAASNDWSRFVDAVQRGGSARAIEALQGGEFGAWNTYGGSSHLEDMDGPGIPGIRPGVSGSGVALTVRFPPPLGRRAVGAVTARSARDDDEESRGVTMSAVITESQLRDGMYRGAPALSAALLAVGQKILLWGEPVTVVRVGNSYPVHRDFTAYWNGGPDIPPTTPAGRALAVRAFGRDNEDAYLVSDEERFILLCHRCGGPIAGQVSAPEPTLFTCGGCATN